MSWSPLVPFNRAAAWVAGIAVVGLGVAAAGPWGRAGRTGAVVGMALVLSSAPLSLVLKKWAVTRSLQAALAAMVLVFMGRLVTVVAGLVLAKQWQLSQGAYVLGFFSGYFALQAVEVAYVLAEWKQLGSRRQ